MKGAGMRVQTEEVGRRIVNAAYESFWRLGYRRASVDLIAARAGVTKRTVYGYFRSKDDLLAAVLQPDAKSGGSLRSGRSCKQKEWRKTA
jgi:AcrR family transcriptional regulator